MLLVVSVQEDAAKLSMLPFSSVTCIAVFCGLETAILQKTM